jgi:hypothetical protein
MNITAASNLAISLFLTIMSLCSIHQNRPTLIIFGCAIGSAIFLLIGLKGIKNER